MLYFCVVFHKLLEHYQCKSTLIVYYQCSVSVLYFLFFLDTGF